MREKHSPPQLKIDNLLTFEPLTKNQRSARSAWKQEGHHLVLNGAAGTGKTFNALYLALEDVLDKQTPWDNIHIIRSALPTRDFGFLPGSEEEKLFPFIAPYISICSELFDYSAAYQNLVEQGIIGFHSTSYIRGTTFDSSVIIVDEMQNMTFHELDSVITRVGIDTRIIFCGDYYQSDLKTKADKQGLLEFLEILKVMQNFSIIEFGWDDIVRSDFVRDYIMTKEMILRGDL